jgi:hypothetical protein
MKVLELFSGTGSFSNVAKNRSVIPGELCLQLIKAMEIKNAG